MEQKTNNAFAVSGFIDVLSKETTEYVQRHLQKCERDRFEYDEAKLIVQHYEMNAVENEALMKACREVLKTREIK